MSEPLIGRKLGHYRIVEKLGVGGMGEVYRARDERLGRDVALKIVAGAAPDDASARERLLGEARLASSLNHPNISTIYEAGEEDGRIYIAMEYVAGRTLQAVIPPGGLPADSVARYGAQIAAALAHAHERRVIHRDVKPSNVLLTPSGQAKVLDFGVAKHLSEAELEEATRSEKSLGETGAFAGTLPYMAPEVFRGGPVDARSDVWSLGVLLYEMASGARPFQGQTGFAASSAILREPPAPLPPHVPPPLRAIILRCLAKEPGERYQQASEACAALEALGHEPAEVQPAGKRLRRIPWRRAGLSVGVIAALVVAALAALKIAGRRRRPAATPAAIHSLAVLPLENLSRDPEQEYFADGMTDELIADLVQIRALRVISRTSVMRYKETSEPLPQIAKQLDVDALVEGSVERAGNRVRITAELFDAADRELWSETFERDLKDVLTLQDEVARDIADQIRIQVTPGEKARLERAAAVSPEAHEAYLEGLFYWNKRTGPDEWKAIGYFEQAIKKDPQYAAAYSGLADTYRVLSFTSNVAPADVFPQSEAAARRALALDNQLAEAHVSLGADFGDYDWDWPKGEREIQQALRLNPNSADVHFWVAHFLMQMGDAQGSIREGQRGAELDPVSLSGGFIYGQCLYAARRYDDAIAQFRRVLELGPNFWPAHLLLGKTLAQQGHYQEALKELKKAGDFTAEPEATMGYVYARMGRRAEAEKILADLLEQSKRSYVAPTQIAKIYGALGEKDQAFAWLEKGYKVRDTFMTFLRLDPIFDPLRSDPRFAALLARVGPDEAAADGRLH